MALKDKWVDKINEVDNVDANDINTVANAVIEIEKTLENNGTDAENGATFTPSVSADGTLSWTNDKGLDNPPSVNIKGANGKDGSNGKDGVSATHSWNGTTLTITSASGTSSANLKGDKGDKGDTGAAGPKGPQGEQGPQGDTYTLTEYDKKEIGDLVNAVRYESQSLTEEQKAQARKNIDALGIADISLGIASDGLIYVFINGVPVGTGIPQGQSGDVFGYVDENNTIMLKGNLATDNYFVKYEMENGSTVDIGELKFAYSVKNMLTNCTNSNKSTIIGMGDRYSATITANSGYELKSISVTMGGSPVSVSGNIINISNVTGDIVITAVAEETAITPTYTNLLPLAVDSNGNDYKGDNGEDGYRTGYKLSTSSGTEKANTSNPACVSGYFSINNNTDTIRIKNIAVGSVATIANIGFYKADKTYIRGIPGAAGFMGDNVSADENGVYKFSPKKWLNDTETTDIGFFRFSCAEITDETIVTVNEEIV